MITCVDQWLTDQLLVLMTLLHIINVQTFVRLTLQHSRALLYGIAKTILNVR